MLRQRLQWCKESWLIVVGLGFSIRQRGVLLRSVKSSYADVDIEAVVRCWI